MAILSVAIEPSSPMHRAPDLKDRTFGVLEVLGRAPKNPGRKASQWYCRCKLCSKITVVRGQALRGGTTTSCGCTIGAGLALRPEEVRRRAAEYRRRRYRADPIFALACRMRTLIRFSLKRPGFVKSKKTETLLGYSIPSLATHLRRTVPPGYTWNDFLSGELQIDHRKPLASFAITGEDCPAFREAWAMSNLCLLPGIPNRKKGARLLAA